jgi:hypothetical protein
MKQELNNRLRKMLRKRLKRKLKPRLKLTKLRKRKANLQALSKQKKVKRERVRPNWKIILRLTMRKIMLLVLILQLNLRSKIVLPPQMGLIKKGRNRKRRAKSERV